MVGGLGRRSRGVLRRNIVSALEGHYGTYMSLPRPSYLLALALAGCASGAVQGAGPSLPAAAPVDEPTPAVLVRRPPSSSGALEGDAAGWALFEQAGELGACYADAGGAALGRGVVYVVLDVEPGGRVDRATIGHSDVRSSRFEACLRQALLGVAMPASAGGSRVQAHLVFGAGDRAEGRAMLVAYRATRAVAGGGGAGAAVAAEAIPLTGLRSRIQTCYERRLRGRPGLRGRMLLELTVESDGQVSRAGIAAGAGGDRPDRGPALDDALSRCVLGAVRNVRLAGEYASSATLTYPVVFEPGR